MATRSGRVTPVETSFPDDAALLTACRRGDDAAWRELMSRYRDLIYSLARRQGLDRDDAADVFQAVVVALWKGLATLRSEKALTRWIEVTTCRQAARLVARLRRSDQADEDIDPPEPGKNIGEALEATAREFRVRRALGRLGGRCRELLVRLYVEDPPRSYEAVARELDMPVGSVGPTRGRCLAKLRELLEKS